VQASLAAKHSEHDQIMLAARKKLLVDAVASYMRDITTIVPPRISPVVPPTIHSAARDFHSYVKTTDLPPGNSIAYAVRDGMNIAYALHIPKAFNLNHIHALKLCFGVFVSSFDGDPKILDYRFEKLIQLAKNQVGFVEGIPVQHRSSIGLSQLILAFTTLEQVVGPVSSSDSQLE
jgi:hypothetical protein